MKPGEFTQNVWKLARSIPPGRVTTYGLLATAAGGHPMLAQMITYILGKAPDSDTLPFHRIVYSGGRVWLFDDPQKRTARLKLYQKEGIKLDQKNRVVNFDKLVFTFGNTTK